MKKILHIALAFLLLVCGRNLSAQHAQLYAIAPYPLEITYYKTVNLIFPYSIKSVDKGSRDLLAQKAKGIENILQVKAARTDMVQTNLTVITSDGRLHSFLVDYAAEPLQLNLEVVSGLAPPKEPVALLAGNEEHLKKAAQNTSRDNKTTERTKAPGRQVSLSLGRPYIHQDVLFLRLAVSNHSRIGYDIQSLRFLIRDKKQTKRTAVQETLLSPLYILNDTSVVAGKSQHDFVFALPKFTIPDQKYLAIQLMEKNGARHMELRVGNRTLSRARPVL